MTDDRMALIELVEKQAVGDLVREMLDLHRFRSGLLRAILAIKEIVRPEQCVYSRLTAWCWPFRGF